MSTDINAKNDGTATAVEVMTSTNGGTMVSSQDNNNNQTSNMNNIQYTPELLSRYIHYYKTGQDINNPNISSSTNTISTTNNTAEQQPPKKKKKKKHKKLKHIPPLQLSTRRTIQNCCKTSNLSLALITFYNALVELIYIDGSVFYQLLNLCESGGGGDSSGDMKRKVHVGTPKNNKRDDKEKVAIGSNIEVTETTVKPIKITLKQRIQHASTIHQLLSSLHIPLIEQAYTALIRLSVRNNDYEAAERYLTEAESTQQCKVKLRLYSTLLRGYCGDFPSDSSSSSDDVVDDDISSEDEKQENNKYNKKPTKEGLIKALATWKRLYDNSGGLSTGHPNYAELNSNNSNSKKPDGKLSDTSTNNKDDNKNQKQQEETMPLFGEGISPKITLSEVEYTSILKAATYLHDTKVIQRILSNVADEIQVPGRECRDAIVDWFRMKESDTKDKEKAEDDIDESQSALDEVTLPPSEVDLTTFVCVTNGSGWSIYNNCSIDTSTGELTLENSTSSSLKNDNEIHQTSSQVVYKLKPVELSTKSWKSMTNMNRTIVLNGSITGNVSKFQGGGKGKKRPRNSSTNNGISEVHGNNSKDRKSKSWTVKDNSTATTDEKKKSEKEKNKPQSNWRINAWNNFEKFIEEHPPYNIVIDGANVGYFNQSFHNAPKHVDYNQIDHLLRHLLENNPNHQQKNHIILFLHERHFTSKIVPQYANEIISKWDSNVAPNKLTVYRTPSGMNDDWFWMHAALYNGGSSSTSSSSLSSPSSTGVMAITNDEMRDHHFQMSCNQAFVRWKERHQIYFDFGLWNKELNRRDVILRYPMVYSRRIQWIESEGEGGRGAFVIPLPKKGDEGRFVDGMHVADKGVPEEETYVVICSNPLDILEELPFAEIPR